MHIIFYRHRSVYLASMYTFLFVVSIVMNAKGFILTLPNQLSHHFKHHKSSAPGHLPSTQGMASSALKYTCGTLWVLVTLKYTIKMEQLNVLFKQLWAGLELCSYMQPFIGLMKLTFNCGIYMQYIYRTFSLSMISDYPTWIGLWLSCSRLFTSSMFGCVGLSNLGLKPRLQDEKRPPIGLLVLDG